MSAQQPPIAMFVCSLMAPFAVFALGTAPQIDAQDSQAPTTIERALIERACNAADTSPLADTDARQQCLGARLLSLRTAFGRDLSRLSGADRKGIDAACGPLRTDERREPYLDCLSIQLADLRLRQNRGNRAAPEDAAVAPLPLTAPAAVVAPPAKKAAPWPSATVIGGIVGGAIAVVGAALLALRSRRAPPKCRVCGANVSHSDLCAACRHEAAEVVRRAVEERAHNQRAQEEEERRQRNHQTEQREQRARDDEEARMRDQEFAHQREEAARHAAVGPIGPAVEEAVDEEEDAFDPYVVLGVSPEASQEDIGAAYQQAKTKYDPDLVSYLGDETQAHFKAKVEAIERAYQVLTDVRP
jgi:DnaJ-domain-containing protein 1